MGIIAKQSGQGLIVNYVGVILGFVVVMFRAKTLDENLIGVVEMLITYGEVFSTFLTLGYGQITIKLYPLFRSEENGDNGYLKATLLFFTVAAIISSLLIIVFRDPLLASKGNDTMLGQYYWLVVPWVVSRLAFKIFDTYLRMNYKAVFGSVLLEIFQRVGVIITILLFVFKVIGVDWFIYLYALSFMFSGLVILFYVFVRYSKKVTSKINRSLFAEMKPNILNLGMWGSVGIFSSLAVVYIDRYMLNYFLSTEAVGIYVTLLAFGVIISIPSRPIKRISISVISDCYKNNDLKNINLVYQKSSLILMIISVYLFIGIWQNVPSLLKLLDFNQTYLDAVWVVFFLGLAYVVDMTTGINNEIISVTEHYRYNTYFVLILSGIAILFNWIFITHFGIVGAAIGTLLSFVLINFLRLIFLKVKYDLFPFNTKFLIALIVGCGTFFIGKFIPKTNQHLLDILINGISVTLVYWLTVYFLNLSEDLNNQIKNLINKVLRR